MTPTALRRARSRSVAVLVSGAATITLYLIVGSLFGADSGAQIFPTTTTTTTTPGTPTTPTTPTTLPTEWDGSHWTAPTADGATVADGTFSGQFEHHPGSPAKVELNVGYSSGDVHPTACDPAPGLQAAQTAPTSSDPQTDTMSFLFEVSFRCNGLYDVTATADTDPPTEPQGELTLTALKIAVPPQRPDSFLATDSGNHTVTLTWTGPSQRPPDLAGFRLSRRDNSTQSFTTIGEVAADVASFADSTVPASGGSFFYEVQTLRTSPNGVLTSAPVATSEALVVGGSTPGSSVTGKPGTAASDGTTHFDEPTTLAADEGEEGGNDPIAALPGGATIQRFAGHDGAGLLKPIAAALNLGVWAGILLFLTRRAAKDERAMLLQVDFEQPAQERGGPMLVEGLVPVAALGGLHTGGTAIGARAFGDDLERRREVPVRDLVPEFRDAGAPGVAVVDQDRRPTRVRLKRR